MFSSSFFFQAEDGIRDATVTGVQTCALPISPNGTPERPAPLGVQVADLAGGAWPAAAGILAALVGRGRTGQGAHVDVSMTEGALAMLALPLAMAWTRGTPISRGRELLDGGAACYAVYRARDGKLVALEPKFFAAFCAAVGRPELAERQLEDGGRGPRAELEAIFASRTRDEWADFGGRHDVCLAPVLEGDEPQADPQLAARGAFVGVPVPGQARRMPAAATPIRIRGAPPPPPTAGPRAGEHTDEVLAEAGFAADEIAALRRGGVLEA